ncbi:hypothetical protein [Halioxenophilus sp. WMMB6]|uniref:hypothetical protein n=1 Tax=Halioxenophilus sp. WMMB6 TaxID=3073815 RepID=UPI00295E9B6F|nr:hypothetical protein [Halioxenophilus sp. WMMB6]
MQVNTKLLLVLFGGLLTAVVQADESEWLGAEAPKHSLGVRVGADTENQTLAGADLQLGLPNYSQIALAYSATSVDDDGAAADSRHWLAAFTTDPIAKWSLAAEYRSAVEESTLETRDWEFQAQYYPGSWLLRVGFITGQVEADNPFDGVRGRDFRDPEFDRLGLSLLYSGYAGNWRLDLSGVTYDYEENIPEQIGNRRLTLYMAQRTLSGLLDLTDHRLGMAINYQRNNWAYQVGVSQYQYAITEEKENSLSAGVTYYLSDTFSWSAFAAGGLEDNIYYGESALRFHW